MLERDFGELAVRAGEPGKVGVVADHMSGE
jgi:hypothetical protein